MGSNVTIPYIGFSRKRYKGLFLGCLIQPIVCIAIAVVAIMSGFYYMASTVKEQRKAAIGDILQGRGRLPYGHKSLLVCKT